LTRSGARPARRGLLLSHARIWSAIDRLAERHNLTTSGLARRAGLDPTTFNKSKRTSSDGRPRWPSTESLAKVLDATQTPMDAFLLLIEQTTVTRYPRSVPLLGQAQAGRGGFFDDGGYPAGQGSIARATVSSWRAMRR
jgi:phage repressor protein C with HTH and peptisase S24 domain